jgi:hypothetical protein
VKLRGSFVTHHDRGLSKISEAARCAKPSDGRASNCRDTAS